MRGLRSVLRHVSDARRLLAQAAALSCAAMLPAVTAAAPTAPRGGVDAHLFVSTRGSDHASCSHSAPCRTISHAVRVAQPGDEVDVEAGRYAEKVVITKRLTIRGLHAPTIDAKGRANAILIKGDAPAGSTVTGLVLEHATYEGVLALETRDVTIEQNFVHDNDRGFFAPRFKGECAQNGHPGAHVADLRAGGCGEAIHLASTSRSRVVGNTVTGNTGGIYLTDESGPAAHNYIAGNQVVANLYDCGITLASHSRYAVSATGPVRPRPHSGGVYDNLILRNVADWNGVREAGAGVLVAAAFRGGAAYGNRIIGNRVSRNGLPGITIHSHHGRQDVDGNIIRGNVVGHNAVGGTTGGPGDGDVGLHRTAGILVSSEVRRVTGTRIVGNRISDDYYGIWTKNVKPLKTSGNGYNHVQVPVKRG
ncbi:MAG: nitrous oxide reductase family maturation protein NosD [Solirubrobacteraceae bacterium]